MQAEVTLGMFTEFGGAVQLLIDRGQQRVDYTHWLKSCGYYAILTEYTTVNDWLGTKTKFLCLILLS